MSAKKNLNIQQGSTFRLKFSLSKTTDGITMPIDLSEATVKMQIRPTHRSDALYLDLYEGGYISIIDAPNGMILIDIPANVTESLSFSKAVYDIQIEFLDNYIIRPIEGYVSLSPEVTR